ncbi:MAG: Crp/Fnr family transcriptional regulator [Arcicella sp.]|jgi:CRP-like cAMP-binding protein|nr:Crp/Fnr family transcriptional regulator [Arcicella sp.]
MSLSSSNKIHLVKESIFRLANFSSEEWDYYQNIIDEVSFKKKEFLTKKGAVEKYAYFILEGAVKYEATTEEGKAICVDLGFQGNLVSSFAACLSQRPSAISIQAVTNIKAFRLYYPPVLELLETSKNAERFHRLIAEQLYIRETRRTYTLISKTAEQRYLHLLENQPDALRLIPIKDLASYLGIHPDSLSRIRNSIKN